MNGIQALNELKRLEAEGRLADVLDVEIIDTGDVANYAEPLYEGLEENEKPALDKVLADRYAVADAVDQALDDINPFGEEFISCLQEILNEKVRDELSK
jgi:hypothetical protein